MSHLSHLAAPAQEQVTSFTISRTTMLELAVALDRARDCLRNASPEEYERLQLREASDMLESAWAAVVHEIAQAQTVPGPRLELKLAQRKGSANGEAIDQVGGRND